MAKRQKISILGLMFLLEIAAINKGIFKEGLTYFSKEEVPVGALVLIEIRNTENIGLVTKTIDVRSQKGGLKTADFKLKKIKKVLKTDLYPKAYMQAYHKTADYFAAPLGQTIKQFLPKSILTDNDLITTLNKQKPVVSSAVFAPQTLHGADKFILQEPRSERYDFYKNLVRETLARKQSLMIIVPEIAQIAPLHQSLAYGIEDYVYVIHGKQKPSEQKKVWAAAAQNPKSVILIGTRQVLSIPRSDLGLIIVEEEASSAHKSMDRPYIDNLIIAEYLSEATHAKLILADHLIRVSTYQRFLTKNLSSLSRLKNHIGQGLGVSVVSPSPDPNIGKKVQPLCGPELIQLLKFARHNQEKLIIFTHQTGLHPITICGDCSTIITCPDCHKPLTLHRRDLNNSFICHNCGYQTKALDKCPNCHGYRLNLVGGGSTLIFETVKGILGGTNLFLLDKEKAKTEKGATALAAEFYNTKDGVIITTEFGLNYLTQKVPYVIIASIDSLFMIPNYQIYEKAARLVLSTINLAEKHLLIQTKMPTLPLFEQFSQGSLLDFFESELSDRKDLGYPPFTVIIKISAKETAKHTDTLSKLGAAFGAYQARLVRQIVGQKQPVVSLIFKVPTGLWPDLELVAWVKELAPTFTVEIDPESIL